MARSPPSGRSTLPTFLKPGSLAATPRLASGGRTSGPTWLKAAARALADAGELPTPRKKLDFSDASVMRTIKRHRLCKEQHCEAFTKQGAPCRNCAVAGKRYCSVHIKAKSPKAPKTPKSPKAAKKSKQKKAK